MQFIFFFAGKIHKYVYYTAFNFSLETIEHNKYIFSISTELILCVYNSICPFFFLKIKNNFI